MKRLGLSTVSARDRLIGFFRSEKSDSSSNTYIYKPLDRTRREIRLLIIQRAKNREDTIHCRVYKTAFQDAKRKYQALSYTWGDPSATRPIFLNGYRFEITVNLEEF